MTDQQRILFSRNAIPVSAADGIIPCAGIIFYTMNAVDCNVARKKRIHFVLQIFCGECFSKVGVKKLCRAMNPCVCTATSDNLNRSSENFGERVLQNLLHTFTIWLCLPSVIGCTQIRNFKKPTHVQKYKA